MSREQGGAPGAPASLGHGGWDLLAVVAVVTGTVIRARHFFAGQSLWLDEAMLAVNILSRSCRELLGSLSFDQAAPPLYLCVSRAVALPSGGSELGLRLPSLAAGLLALVLVWRVGRSMVGPESAAWATWLLAISPLAIHYSNEVKPYMSDAVVTVFLLGLAFRALADPCGRTPSVWLAGAGLIALITSFTAPLVLGATGLVLIFDAAARHDRAAALRACGLGVLWLAAFMVLYLTLYRPAGSSEFLQAYWRDYFLSFGPGWRAGVVNAVTGVTSALPLPAEFVRARYLLPTAIVAVVLVAWRTGWRVTGLLVLPFLVLCLAALLRRYPIGERLVLFLSPAAVLLAATGLVAGTRLAGLRQDRGRSVVLGLLVAGMGVSQLADPRPAPGGARTARDLVHHVDSVSGADLVLLTRHGAPTWLYYTTDWRDPDRDRLAWFSSRFDSLAPVAREDRDPPPQPPVDFRTPPPGSRNGRPEALAPPSGLGFRVSGRSDSVYASWGPSLVAQHRARPPVTIWIYGGRPAELAALAAAWDSAGARVVRHGLSGGGDLLEVRDSLASARP